MPRFDGEQLVELALHPITLGYGKSRAVRGRPLFADGELGEKILDDLVRLSAPMGTKSPSAMASAMWILFVNTEPARPRSEDR